MSSPVVPPTARSSPCTATVVIAIAWLTTSLVPPSLSVAVTCTSNVPVDVKTWLTSWPVAPLTVWSAMSIAIPVDVERKPGGLIGRRGIGRPKGKRADLPGHTVGRPGDAGGRWPALVPDQRNPVGKVVRCSSLAREFCRRAGGPARCANRC